MKPIRLSILILIISIVVMIQSPKLYAETSVWKVSTKDTYLYLAGTMHILSTNDYPLPPEFEKAYADASRIVLETDLEKLNSPAFAQLVADLLSYRDGTTLFDRLSPETAHQLKAYLKSKNIPEDSVTAFKPGMLMSVLSSLELRSLGLNGRGVDAHFYHKATNDAKTIQPLETVEMQLGFLAALGGQDPDKFVRYLLKELPNTSTLVNKLRDAWKSGDMKVLTLLGIATMQQDYPAMYQQLLVERNNQWLPQIESMLENEIVEMVLVGALHLAGTDGLLRQLTDAGYSLEQL